MDGLIDGFFQGITIKTRKDPETGDYTYEVKMSKKVVEEIGPVAALIYIGEMFRDVAEGKRSPKGSSYNVGGEQVEGPSLN